MTVNKKKKNKIDTLNIDINHINLRIYSVHNYQA